MKLQKTNCAFSSFDQNRTSPQTGMCSSSLPPHPRNHPYKCSESQLKITTQLGIDLRTVNWVYDPPGLELTVKIFINCRNIRYQIIQSTGILQTRPSALFHWGMDLFQTATSPLHLIPLNRFSFDNGFFGIWIHFKLQLHPCSSFH